MRPPSLGFCYLVATAAAATWGWRELQRPMFYELPAGSAERDLQEARYLLRLARSAPERSREWSATALGRALSHRDYELADTAVALLADDRDVTPALRELVPGACWGYRVDDDGVMSRSSWLLVLNPEDRPRRVTLRFQAPDARATVETALVPAAGTVVVGIGDRELSFDGLEFTP